MDQRWLVCLDCVLVVAIVRFLEFEERSARFMSFVFRSLGTVLKGTYECCLEIDHDSLPDFAVVVVGFVVCRARLQPGRFRRLRLALLLVPSWQLDGFGPFRGS